MNVLEINNVSKRFGNLVAVRDVSLNVAPGELCAIIGPNGERRMNPMTPTASAKQNSTK